MFEDFNFGEKVSKIYRFSNIDEKLRFDEQLYSYKEDMLYVCYEKDYVLDIGWYPDFDPKGSFKIVVVKNDDWDNPVLMKRCKKINVLKKYIKKFVIYIQKEIGK